MLIHGFDTEKCWDYENGYFITSDPRRIGKVIAHYELYKKIIELPGEIVECGIFKGTSFVQWATFRDCLESPYSRKLIGFDIFGYFPKQEIPEDEKIARAHDAEGGSGLSKEALEEVMQHKRFHNFELIAGDINHTVPAYMEKNSHLKISLLHIDVDIYSATYRTLEAMYDCVVPGGLIVFDDYGVPFGNGETRAVDEFFTKKKPLFKKLSISHIPTYYVKE